MKQLSFSSNESNISNIFELHKFIVVGIITSQDFQKCKYAVLKLRASFPKEFDVPEIRPMLDVEWNEFITKWRRKLGGGLWSIKNRVVVFKNKELLGDFNDLFEFIWQKWKYVFNEDWHLLAMQHLADFLKEKTDNCRQLAYLTIALNGHVIGSLLFELYNDIVPLACENFITRCNSVVNGYLGVPVHRIVQTSWVQFGGHNLSENHMPCENYVITHNRRGVLSTCNDLPHKNNSTQFFVSLENSPWMDYKYVAFGQLLQGDDVLRTIEKLPTYYESPLADIKIVKCGEFQTNFYDNAGEFRIFTTEEIEQWKEIDDQMDILTYLKLLNPVNDVEDQPLSPSSVKPLDSQISVLTETNMRKGLYCPKSDNKSYFPFYQLPGSSGDDFDEGAEDYVTCGPDHPIKMYRGMLYDDTLTPKSSDFTI